MESFHEFTVERLSEFLGNQGIDGGTINILKDELIDGISVLECNEEDFGIMGLKMGPKKRILKLIRETKTQLQVNEICRDDKYFLLVPNSSSSTPNTSMLSLPSSSAEKSSMLSLPSSSEANTSLSLQSSRSSADNSMPSCSLANTSLLSQPSCSSSRSTSMFSLPSTSKRQKTSNVSLNLNAQPAEADVNKTIKQEAPEVTSSVEVVPSVEMESADIERGPQRSIRVVLSETRKGRELIHFANKGPMHFKTAERCSLVRLLVDDLVKHYGHYPPEEIKIDLANEIVNEFPILKDRDLNTDGYEHFYDQKTKNGFIEFRIQNLRKHLLPLEKKYKRRKTGQEIVNDKLQEQTLTQELMFEHITWMKNTLPTTSNENSISQSLEVTFPNRHIWIKSSEPTVQRVFEFYPRLKDFSGEMILQEFERIHHCRSYCFLQKFSTLYVDNILKFCEAQKYDLWYQVSNKISDNNLRALVILAELFPKANFHEGKHNKKSQQDDCQKTIEIKVNHSKPKFAYEDLIVIEEEGLNVETFLQESEDKLPSLPYLLCIKSGSEFTQEDELIYFVIAGGQMINLGTKKGVLNAFDILFKMHVVANAKYAPSLRYFYNFIEYYIFGLNCPYPSVKALNITLTNII